jgi:hypothetical protein
VAIVASVGFRVDPTNAVRMGRAEPGAASLAEHAVSPRHHIGQFSTPQKRYFGPTLLAGPDRLSIVGWSQRC